MIKNAKAMLQNKPDLSGDAGKNKLARKHKYFVCTMIATGYSDTVIVQQLEETYGIQCAASSIRDAYRYGAKWKPLIKRITEKFQDKILDHPLAQKANRLNILEKALSEAFKMRTVKINYTKSGKELSRVKGNYPAIIANLVREARLEVEGEKPTVIVNNDNRKAIMTSIHHNYNGNGKVKDEEQSGNDTRNRLTIAK